MDQTYQIVEVSARIDFDGFKEVLEYYKLQGYVIPGVITDYANDTVIVLIRKPTPAEIGVIIGGDVPEARADGE